MWNKTCFRSFIGNDVVDNRFTVSGLFHITVSFISLTEVTDLHCYCWNPESTSKIDFSFFGPVGRGGGGGKFFQADLSNSRFR